MRPYNSYCIISTSATIYTAKHVARTIPSSASVHVFVPGFRVPPSLVFSGAARFRMPLNKEDKRAVIIFLCICVVFIQAGLYAGRRSISPPSTPRANGQWTLSSFSQPRAVLKEHPIPQLMAEAEEKFKQLLSRQSTTLKRAVAEYKRRYGRNPPKGFDQWWDFARRHNVKIVDDYDAIFEDLSPFWDMSGEEFRTRVDVVRGVSSLAHTFG